MGGGNPPRSPSTRHRLESTIGHQATYTDDAVGDLRPSPAISNAAPPATRRPTWSYALRLGRPASKATDPDTGLTVYGYDNNGNQTSVDDATYAPTVYTRYDSLNRPTSRCASPTCDPSFWPATPRCSRPGPTTLG